MSVGTKLLQAAAGNAGGDPTYVDDVFSCFLYEGTGGSYGVNTSIVHGIQTGIRLGDSGVGTSTKFAHNTDFLSRSSDLTGNADGKTFTFSCWVFLTPKIDDNQRTLYATDSSDNGILIAIQSNNTLSMEAWNGGVRTLQLSTTTVLPTNAFTNILVSLDFANSSNRYIYFNDEAATVTYNTYNNANVEFTRSTHYIGIWGNGSTRGLHNDNLAHLYLDYTYRDLSTESNRRIFIDANGGSTAASTLAALNPIMYIPMTTAYAVGKNAGTGGDFTANGSPTIVENGTEYVADSGEGGLVWFGRRDNGDNHFMSDTVRGATKTLRSNTNGAETTDTSAVTSFTSSGFTLGGDGSVNNSSGTFVAWTFAKQAKFFDIVTYTGSGSVNHTINHNLGSVPGTIIFKRTGASDNWGVYHRSHTGYLILDRDQAGESTVVIDNVTSTSFRITRDFSFINEGSNTYVAYLFAHDAQDFGTDSDEAIIKCGSYTGNGNSDGPTIDLGFEPQWIMWKRADSGTESWHIRDVMRGMPVTASGKDLYADSSSAEGSTTNEGPIPTANGFKLVGTNTNGNASGGTYIYMAIRRPHKPASEFAATNLFKVAPRSNTASADNAFVSNFPVDMGMSRNVLASTEMRIGARLTGDQYLETPTADAETTESDWGGWDSMNSVSLGFSKSAETPIEKYGWMFRRAPGFFDVVCYTGSGSAGTMTINHNLGVVPEMMWVKARSASYNWWAAHTFTASNAVKQYPAVNGAQAGSTESYGTSLGLNAQPTSTSFVVNTDTMIGRTYDWVAYLFASVDGISKVGTYTGTTNDVNVDCGFSSGARFVLVKRTDAVGDWYLWDSERGIVAGNDPYILLSTTGAQDSSEDFIDPLSSGFTITSNATTPLNANNGTYLFYAIA